MESASFAQAAAWVLGLSAVGLAAWTSQEHAVIEQVLLSRLLLKGLCAHTRTYAAAGPQPLYSLWGFRNVPD